MPLNIRKLMLVVGAIGFIVCTLLFFYYPAAPHTVLGWLALIFVGLPVWAFLEWIGERVLGMQLLTNLSSSMRIVIAIPFVILIVIASALLVQFVQKLVGLN